MTICTHGHAADPKLCRDPKCKGALGHVDPDIQAEWDRAAKELARRLRPYVQDHLVWGLAHGFVSDMSAEGFRPPLRPVRRPSADPPAAAPPQEYLEAKAAITSLPSPPEADP